MINYERMNPKERESCAALAAHAFSDYDYFVNYIPNDRKRWRFRVELREG